MVETQQKQKRWKEYTDTENYTHTHKDINESDKHDDVVSYPEPDILEYEVNWALGSTAVNKPSGCNRITVKVKVKSLSCNRLFATRGLQPTMLLRPWDSPGKNTGVGCHFLLQELQ